MDIAACADFFVVSQILEFVPVSDLFNTSEVCRLWQAVSLGLLRRKLRYLCYCHIKPEEKCPPTASGLPKFLEDFCRDLRRFIRIARQAGCSPTFGFLSYSSNPKDEKAVVQQVQSQLSPNCVVVYHRSKTITMRRRDDPTKACSVHRGITGAFLFGPSPLTPCPRRRRPSNSRHLRRSSSNSNSSPAAAGEAGNSSSCPATVARDALAPQYRRQCNFKRSRLEKLSKLLRRAVLRRPVRDPCLRNVAPGVMLFHSFRIPTEDGRSLTTHWKEEHTGRVVAVSLMRLFQQRDAMHVRSLLSSFRREFSPCRSSNHPRSSRCAHISCSTRPTRVGSSTSNCSRDSSSSNIISSNCNSPRDTFVIVLQNCMEDTQELQELVELFPQVPVMSISGEFLRDEELLRMGEPLARRKVIVMVLQLLPPGAEAYVILDDEIEK
ncbi:uncharacterized protein LOC142788257 isoform X1 [Rhipicephalus microplus]|uniref:uncharacterized protein LOC142788257 isoform X1 n=1 Tax=Rhipicephalus microplus TaxID=6941 RepID=UPI003F6C6857